VSNEREAALRRQLTAFAQFTTRSLGESDLDALMTDACLRARAGVDVTHAKLLEYLPHGNRLGQSQCVADWRVKIRRHLILPDIAVLPPDTGPQDEAIPRSAASGFLRLTTPPLEPSPPTTSIS
jgi:hypothetical protein